MEKSQRVFAEGCHPLGGGVGVVEGTEREREAEKDTVVVSTGMMG